MSDRAWYVVYSKPHKEKPAQFHLQLKGVQVFFPRLLLPPSLRVRQRVVPLFPNYLFVQVRLPAQYEAVNWTPGVKRFVSFNDVPVPVEPNVVQYLMARANCDGVITARSNLKLGQEVRISGGPFDGLAGIIQEPPKAGGRVKILMQLLCRPMKVEVPLESIENAGVIYRPTVRADITQIRN
jgi:transcription elongation factor/antiterminator RfaH